MNPTPQSAREAAEMSAKRLNAAGSMGGLRLRNAAGDIDQTSLGYQIAIDTLTYIKKQVTEQKFYEIAPGDYVPIAVGDGAFSENILTNLSISSAGDFEEGNIGQGIANDRLSTADAGVSGKTMQVMTWAKACGFTIVEVEQALRSMNWDPIEQRHRARKKNWDLGIQKMAFLGSKSNNTDFPGLLTQSGVNSDTATITKSISSMSVSEFATFVQSVVQAYRANVAYTAYPTHFILPESDWNGLATPVSSTYPFNSKLEYLKKAFAEIVPGGIKMLPLLYSMPSQNTAYGVNKYRYAMYRFDPESVRMDIPVDITITQPNTVNNFQFQDAGYAQYTGVGVYRNLELMYFDYS